MGNQVIYHFWEVNGELEANDATQTVSEDNGFLKSHGLDDGFDVSCGLGMAEQLVDLDLARGHLTSVESHAGVFVGETSYHVVVLTTMAISSGDECYQRASALIPVVEVAVFIFDS